MTGIFAFLALSSGPMVCGTPGLNTTRSKRQKVSSLCGPSSSVMPMAMACCAYGPSCSSVIMSATVTCAPWFFPVRARPTTNTFLSLRFGAMFQGLVSSSTRPFGPVPYFIIRKSSSASSYPSCDWPISIHESAFQKSTSTSAY